MDLEELALWSLEVSKGTFGCSKCFFVFCFCTFAFINVCLMQRMLTHEA